MKANREKVKFFYDKETNIMTIIEIIDSKRKSIRESLPQIERPKKIKVKETQENYLDVRQSGFLIILGNIDLRAFQSQIDEIEINQIRENLKNIYSKMAAI